MFWANFQEERNIGGNPVGAVSDSGPGATAFLISLPEGTRLIFVNVLFILAKH